MATSFTPQQIEEFLQQFFDVVGTRQYKGMRYVPIFGRAGEDSIDFDNSKPYQPLTIVLYQGNSYTSRTYVPAGVPITNQHYWANTGNYNAQVEAYREEVVDLKEEWQDYKTDLEGELDDWKSDTVEEFEEAIDNLPEIIPASDFTSSSTVKDYIDEKAGSRGKKRIALYIGNSYTQGVGSTSGTDGVMALTESLFDEAYSYTIGGSGFGPYTGHAVTFYNMIQSAAAMTEFDNEDITHIIVTSAMGCTRSIAEGNETDLMNNLDAFCAYAREHFPNAKVYVHYAECTLGRNVQSSYGNWYYMAQMRVHYLFKKRAIRAGYCYLGWTGWNCNNIEGFNDTDGYHPNDLGYRAIATSFLCAWSGQTPYIEPKQMVVRDETDTYDLIEISQREPDECIIMLTEATVNGGTILDGGISSQATSIVGTLVSPTYLAPVLAFLPHCLVTVRIASGQYATATLRTTVYRSQQGDITPSEVKFRLQFAFETPTIEDPGNIVFYSSPVPCRFHPNANLDTINYF